MQIRAMARDALNYSKERMISEKRHTKGRKKARQATVCIKSGLVVIQIRAIARETLNYSKERMI